MSCAVASSPTRRLSRAPNQNGSSAGGWSNDHPCYQQGFSLQAKANGARGPHSRKGKVSMKRAVLILTFLIALISLVTSASAEPRTSGPGPLGLNRELQAK
jgi:hypothetical protein